MGRGSNEIWKAKNRAQSNAFSSILRSCFPLLPTFCTFLEALSPGGFAALFLLSEYSFGSSFNKYECFEPRSFPYFFPDRNMERRLSILDWRVTNCATGAPTDQFPRGRKRENGHAPVFESGDGMNIWIIRTVQLIRKWAFSVTQQMTYAFIHKLIKYLSHMEMWDSVAME